MAICGKHSSWKHRVGNFYVMTSANTPSPFVANNLNTIFGGQAWNAFDDNTSTGCTGGSNHKWDGWTEIKIDFGGTVIKPKKIILRTNNLLDTTRGIRVIQDSSSGIVLLNAGQKVGGSQMSANVDTEFSISSDVVCSALFVYLVGNPQVQVTLRKCQVTEWYEK